MATVIYKGQIGEQDISRFDGSGTNTFTRTTSTGATLTLNKFGYEVNALTAYGGGTVLTDATISSALTALGTTNNATLLLSPGTWVISNDLTITSNIVLKVAAGAVLQVASGKTLLIDGTLDAGLYQIFSGAGDVQGLHKVYPQWFGAVAGYNQTDAQRTINTAAINKAWACATTLTADIINTPTVGAYNYEIWYATMVIDGFFETNSDIVVGTDILGGNGRTKIMGHGSEQSGFQGFGTGNVVDATGRTQLSIENISIRSKTAEIGLLMARIGDGQGSMCRLNEVNIHGIFSIAPLVTISAEELRIVNSNFQNTKSGAAVYASSCNNTLIGATSTLGTFNTTESNSDITFTNCMFLSYTTGMDVIRLDKEAGISFVNCGIVAGEGDNTVNLIHLIIGAYPLTSFNGKLCFTNCLLEGNHANMVYHDYTDTADTNERYWKDISFDGCTITIFNLGTPSTPSIFKYKTLAHSSHHNLNIRNLKITSSAAYIFELCNEVNATIDILGGVVSLLNHTVNLNGFVTRSYIAAYVVTYGTNAYTIHSIIRDSSTHYLTGSAPYKDNKVAVPNTHTPANALRAVVSGMTNFPTLPIAGEIFSVDSGYGANLDAGGGLGSTGNIIPFFWNGYHFSSIGMHAGTATSATGNGVKGTVLFDDSYIYICTASGSETSISTTGDIATGTKVLEVADASDLEVGMYITVAGVTGPQRITSISSTTIGVEPAADATVDDAAVANAVTVWKRIGYSAW